MRLSYSQAQFYYAMKQFVAIFGGKGSGKSLIGAEKAYKKISEDPSVPGIICANTYRQLHTVTLKSFTDCLKRRGFVEEKDFVYNRAPKWYKSQFPENKGILSLRQGGQIICVSLDNFKASDGLNGAWLWNDEGKDTPRKAIEIILERIRLKHRTGTQCFFTTTPAGKKHWLFDMFMTGDPRTFTKFCSTYENKDNLEEGYIDNMLKMYDAKLILERVFGEFIDYSGGSAYYTFNEKNIKNCQLNINRPLHIGMDFNVNPFCAVVCQFLHDNDTVYQPEEIYLSNSNTFEMVRYINDKYKHWADNGMIYIYPDPTGNKRQTSSLSTDIKILSNSGFNVKIRKKIIPVKDRLNVVNGKICNSIGQLGYYIDPRCKNTINDLNKVGLKDDGSIDDGGDKSLTHITDALGYMFYFLFHREVLNVFA